METAKGATACAWTAAMWCRLALLVLVLALLEFPVLAKDSGEVPAARHGCAADALVRARARALGGYWVLTCAAGGARVPAARAAESSRCGSDGPARGGADAPQEGG